MTMIEHVESKSYSDCLLLYISSHIFLHYVVTVTDIQPSPIPLKLSLELLTRK